MQLRKPVAISLVSGKLYLVLPVQIFILAHVILFTWSRITLIFPVGKKSSTQSIEDSIENLHHLDVMLIPIYTFPLRSRDLLI